MSSTYTYAQTFTRVDAARLAGRTATDLHQSWLFYGSPTAQRVEEYRQELELLLTDGYVSQYQFGFKKSGKVVWSLRYSVGANGSLTGGAGGVPRGEDVTGATWFTFLTYSARWHDLTATARKTVQDELPFKRGFGSLPSDTHGAWVVDRNYASGGVGLEREVFRSAA
ncbi:hypothetical protein [Catenulispora rubra]|uniref:HORMA-1 domain-containing protein n=1 Tax=Catenulispora rubra TaxID=280293 RepID=UPI0018924CBE|nr:hypothetical protein [Catenulispora rubra]